MSTAEFERDFPGEGQYVEFKRGTGKEALQDTIVASSNADGGVILIGVEDDGTITGRSLEPGTEDAIYELRKGERADANVTSWYAGVAEEEIFLSVLTIGEIRRGIESVRRRDGTGSRPVAGHPQRR